jgi:hypothetical protein
MSATPINPGLDVIELTIGADDVDILATYGATAKEVEVVEVVSGTGSLAIQTPNSKLEETPAFRTLTVYVGWNKEVPIYKIGGTGKGSTAGLKVQLTFR